MAIIQIEDRKAEVWICTGYQRLQEDGLHVNKGIRGLGTDSDEDVVFVFERCAKKPTEITIDQAKRLALQRDIDQQSQPKEPAKPLSSERLVAEERQAEMVKLKMEEEKSEENPIKKEKKHKKGQANDGSLAEVGKKPKKGKMADAVVIEVGSWDGSGVKGEQKKKKKKKTDPLTVSNGSEVTDGKAVNKKKTKKLLAGTETQVEIAQSLVKEEEVEKKQKKTKAKNKCTQIKQDEKEEEQQVGKDHLPQKVKKGKKHSLAMSTEVTEEQMKEKKKKKKLLADSETQLEVAQSLVKEEDMERKQKKKVKNKSAQMKRENVIKKEEEGQKVEKDNPPKKVKEEEHIDVGAEVTEEQMKGKKKKHKRPLTVDGGTVTTKKKAKMAENGIKLETAEYESEDVKIKQKKKESKAKGDGSGVETTEIKGKSKKSKAVADKIVKSEKQENSTDIVSMDERKTKLKKKAKKDQCKIATLEFVKTEEEEPKKKKRKKVNDEKEPLLDKSEIDQEDKQRRENPREADDTPKKKSKKKKSSAPVEPVSDIGVEPVVKKKRKIKQEREEPGFPQVDVVFLSERSGNADEITINQERRQALQMEIDKASQPDKTVKPTGFGQWSTAQFDSSEQQQKFLRLMGGFKKGFQPTVMATGGENMALGKDAQQQLQQSLLGEFERAQSRRMDFNNRGAGLGFTAPSNKKFSIDINASRSVRFDD